MALVDVVIGLSQKLFGKSLHEDTVITLANSHEPPLDYLSFSTSKMLIGVNPQIKPCKVRKREKSDLQAHSSCALSFVKIIERLG